MTCSKSSTAISSKAIRKISLHEKLNYGLTGEEQIPAFFNKLGLNLKDNVDYIRLQEDGEAIVVVGKNGQKNVTISLGQSDIEEAIYNRLVVLCLIAAPVWKCLDYMPIWYRYWVFRYLESRALDGMVRVERLAPIDLESGFEVTVFTPAYIAEGNHVEYKKSKHAIRRLTMKQTSETDNKNMAIGEVYPFVVSGDTYGFNQVIPQPHFQALCNCEEDYEAVTVRQYSILYTS